MPDELEWRPSSMAFFLEGRSWPFTAPLDLLRFGPLSPRSRVRMGLAVLRLQKTRARRRRRSRAMTAREWIRARDGRAGLREGLGPAAARQVRRPRRRHLDGVAVGQAHDAAPARGQGGAPGAARLPAALVGAAVRRAARPIEARRRARADRPPGRAARASAPTASRSPPARPGSFRTRPRPARLRARRRARALRRGRRDRAQRRLRAACSTTTSRAAIGAEYLGAARAHRVPHRALPAARARPAASAPSTGPTSPTRSCRSSASSSTRTSSSPSATTAGASSTSPTTSRPATRCSSSTPTSCSSATRPGCARSTRASSRSWVARALAAPRAGRAADRHRRLPASGSRRCRPACRGLVLANTTQIYPEDRGTNYAVRLGGDAARGAALARLEQRLVRDRVVAAVAPRVAAQQPPARQHEAAQPARRSRTACDRVVRAGRQVLAAPRQQRRDEALVEADRREQRRRARRSRLAPPSPATSSDSAPRMPSVPSRSASSRASGRATTT